MSSTNKPDKTARRWYYFDRLLIFFICYSLLMGVLVKTYYPGTILYKDLLLICMIFTLSYVPVHIVTRRLGRGERLEDVLSGV